MLPGKRLTSRVFVAWIVTCGLEGYFSSGESQMCPEAAENIGICLHTYLERDFTGLEPFLDFEDRDRRRIMINGPGLEIECRKMEEMVSCYAALDGKCYDIRARQRFSYLLDTMVRVYSWLCENDKYLKDVLENVACILRCQQMMACQPSSASLPENVWQKILRLEVGSDVCRAFLRQVKCAKQSHIIQNVCGNRSHEIYVKGMDLWLAGLCIDGETDSTSIAKPQRLFVQVLIGLLLYHICWTRLFDS